MTINLETKLSGMLVCKDVWVIVTNQSLLLKSLIGSILAKKKISCYWDIWWKIPIQGLDDLQIWKYFESEIAYQRLWGKQQLNNSFKHPLLFIYKRSSGLRACVVKADSHARRPNSFIMGNFPGGSCTSCSIITRNREISVCFGKHSKHFII